MKARLTQGIATVAVFGALFFGVSGGYGSVSAASIDLASQSAVATTSQQTRATSSTSDLRQGAHGTSAIEVSGVPTGHLPLTKGGKFP